MVRWLRDCEPLVSQVIMAAEACLEEAAPLVEGGRWRGSEERSEDKLYSSKTP